ncbi:MFS transporter [Kiloniella laminariae]|uniref:MFS transporter n=1 Tax=Kiloniella laminariae TaxID=454162 RepID=UPI0003A58B26|nr:MFS transporter [Kiloniella laminariae]
MTTEKSTMAVVFMTVLTAFIGYSLPFPIFSHLFLSPEYGLVSADTTERYRTMLYGGAVAMYPLGQMVGGPLLGRWSDLYGRKKVLQLSLVGTVTGAIIMAAGISTLSIPLVFGGYLLAGLCEGNVVIVQSIASDISSGKRKTKNFALIAIAIELGFVFGPLLGGVLADQTLHPWFGPAVPFWAGAALMAANLLIVRYFLVEPKKKTGGGETPAAGPFEGSQRRTLRQTLLDPALSPFYLVTFFSFVSVFALFSFFAPYLVQVFKVQPGMLGIYTAFSAIPMIVIGLVVGRLNDWVGAAALGIVGHFVLAIGLVLYVLPESINGLIIPFCIAFTGAGVVQVATSLYLSNAAPVGEQGQVMGLYRSVMVVAELVIALVGGVLAGYAAGFPYLAGAVAAVICALLLLWIFRRQAQRRMISSTAGSCTGEL